MNTPLLLTGNWNAPFLLVACIGDVLLRCGVKDGAAFADAAVWREERHLRLYDTGSTDVLAKVARRFCSWARDGFHQPFGLDAVEASAIYRTFILSSRAKPAGVGGIANINATIRRWVLADILDPGMRVVVAHFDQKNAKRVRLRPAHNLPRDVRDAVEAYLLAYEPGHARTYVNSWKSATATATGGQP